MNDAKYMRCENATNASGLDYDLAGLSVIIPGSMVFVLILPFVLFNINRFPIGTTGAVLVGGFLMVATGALSQSEAYEVLGNHDNLRTIFLLLGMMIMAQYFEREQLLEWLLQKVLHRTLSFPNYIWRVKLITSILAAFFTNDAACVVVTPLMIKYWKSQNRPQVELESILLAIATSANIGSVVTIFGNPQMALIVSRTSDPLFRLSELDLRVSILYLGPPAMVAFFLNFAFICIQNRRKTEYARKQAVNVDVMRTIIDASVQACPANGDPVLDVCEDNTVSGQDVSAEYMDNDGQGTAYISQNTCKSRDQNTHNIYPRSTATESNDAESELLHELTTFSNTSTPTPVNRTDTESARKYTIIMDEDFKTSGSKIFQLLICMFTLAVTAMLFIKTDHVRFDIGLLPMAAGILTIFADALLNKRSSLPVLRRVDWSVIMMFLAIFVWMRGVNATRIPRWVWMQLGLDVGTFNDVRSVTILGCFVIFLSNVFSNVPLTLIVLEQLVPCKDQLAMVIYLAWFSTIAGNLTLFGSVANLIVAQKARETTDFTLSFWAYLKYGFVTTLVIVTTGAFIISALLQL